MSNPVQNWSSAVQDILACSRGRLPASFLARKLADLGLPDVPPLPKDDVRRFEAAVDVVNGLVAGRPAPGGLKPEAAIAAAFPDDHATLAGLRPLALAYLASFRPAKAVKGRTEAPVEEPQGRRQERGPRREDRDRRDRRDQEARPAPPPRPPRITWDQWLAMHLPGEVAPQPPPPAETVAASPASQPPVVAQPAFIPHPLAAWQVDDDAKRQIARVRDRLQQVLSARQAGQDPVSPLRELAFAILRTPLPVRDDLRGMLVEHCAKLGHPLSISSLHPPPPLTALRRDYENLLVACGPDDVAVQNAWKRMLELHPESRAKLESEREQEAAHLWRRFLAALREHGLEHAGVTAAAGEYSARVAGGRPRIEAELARWRASEEALAACARLVAEKGWDDAEVQAALAELGAKDADARERMEVRRRQELDELERRFRNVLREQGPEHEATAAALARLAERFPAEGHAARSRLERLRRGEDLTQQEQARRAAGKAASEVHLGQGEHRPWRLRPVSRWHLVIAATGLRAPRERGKDREGEAELRRRPGRAVALLVPGDPGRLPLPSGWRAPDCGSLEELDAAVQFVVDSGWGVLGLTLGDCPEATGDAWADAALALAELAAYSLPVEGPTALVVELPSWSACGEPVRNALAGRLAAFTALGASLQEPGPGEGIAGLAEALAWSWGGKRDSEQARIRQSGLAGTCLIQLEVAQREALAALRGTGLPSWPSLGELVAKATLDPSCLSAALLAHLRPRLVGDPQAIVGYHRHLVSLARGTGSDGLRLVRELAWLAACGLGGLRPRDQLRHLAAVLSAQVAVGNVDDAAVERLAAACAVQREDWPQEVLELALQASARVRDCLDPVRAEALIAPWQREDALGCGGRPSYLRLLEERARIALLAGRPKDARRHLERMDEVAARCSDPADRDAAVARAACLRASLLGDDPACGDEEARAVLQLACRLAGAGDELRQAAASLAEEGLQGRRHLHLVLLRWAVGRNDDLLADAYGSRHAAWCDANDPQWAQIIALRAALVAPKDAAAARSLLTEADVRAGQGASPALRLGLLACAVAAALHGVADPGLRSRLGDLRRDFPQCEAAVAALGRALDLAGDTRAALAEALPFVMR